MHDIAGKTLRSSLPLPDKLFYKIGEVSRLTGVESYVLRYWETEFPFLKPRKNKSGQRVYVKKDLEMILELKKMLYQERYTIEGVRKRFGEVIHRAAEPKGVQGTLFKEPQNPASILETVKHRLKDIISKM